MDKSTLARTGIAGAVAGLGLTVGGIALASAETATPDTNAGASAHPGGPRGERGQDAKVLAEELGLKEAVVQKALNAVREDLRPDKPADGTKPTAPTEAERAERQATFATALAKELGISEAKVKAALEVLQKKADADREERRTESRADLVTRLDAAVKAGTLTEADKASVLKAFDAKIIGGFGGGPGGRGGPPPAA